jgi:hypothetical protein
MLANTAPLNFDSTLPSVYCIWGWYSLYILYVRRVNIFYSLLLF